MKSLALRRPAEESPAAGLEEAVPRAAVLLLARDVAGTERELGTILPGRTVLPVRREDIRNLGPVALARRLRGMAVDEIVAVVDDLNSHEALWRLQALLALPLAPRRALVDRCGRRLEMTAKHFLLRDLPSLAGGVAATRLARRRTVWRVRRLARVPRAAIRPSASRRICYLRSDLWSGIAAGGSVGHTAGVVSGLTDVGCEVDLVASSMPAAIDSSRHEVLVVPPRRLYTACRELPSVAHSFVFEEGAASFLSRRPAGLLYQRFDPASHAGVALSRRTGLPLVLEYNGSEVWIADHWGRPLRNRRLFESIEEVNLRHAHLVSVVSAPLRDELVARGVTAERIVVLPNGVDVERYRPDVDGCSVRMRHGLGKATVIGFIGTFGVWHGAAVLARAAARVLAVRPDASVLFVGDGQERRECERILERAGLAQRVVFTGLVPQEEGPAHLAAMDILVAPHVANADGSRFFGSPTKLFEYMAMGRAIVASRLEQIAEVLEDVRTALLVPPGDEASLAGAILRLVDDAGLRRSLGNEARNAAVERHTWRARAAALVGKLMEEALVAWN
jgi:glycosyltransferase involved in cell wall biosynthesis